MDRILTKLKLRRKDKTEVKSLPKNLSIDNPDYDAEYMINGIDRSLTYECKRLSQSYTLLSESPKLNNRRLNGSVSLGALNSISLENNVNNNKKCNKRVLFWSSKPKSDANQPNVQKRGFFSRFRFRKRTPNIQVDNEKDTNLHVVWYKSNNEPEETQESRVQFRHSWADDPKKREIASTIAAELESKSKSRSLFLRNTDRLSFLTETEGIQKF